MWEDRSFQEKNVKIFLIYFRNNKALLDLPMKRAMLILRKIIKGLSNKQFSKLQRDRQNVQEVCGAADDAWFWCQTQLRVFQAHCDSLCIFYYKNHFFLPLKNFNILKLARVLQLMYIFIAQCFISF